jgi:type I restriction enzyme S subunit
MIADFKPYPEYKESGLLWLGQVPMHWETRKLKHVTQFVNGLPFKPADWKASGVPIIRIQNLNGSPAFNYTSRDNLPSELLIQPGDLMFAWSGNRGTSFGPFQWNREFPAYLNQHIFKLVGHTLPNRYFYYVLRAVTTHVEEQAGGIIGLVHVTKPELGSVRVCLAPHDEQAAIVRFLDWANGRLERAMRAKRKVIALLDEQKQAIIHHAVTRGLDPSVPVKPSGIPWLGDIPQHWELRRIKYLLREVDQRSTTGTEPLLSMRMHYGLVPFAEHFKRPPQAVTLVGFKIVRPGQFVVNRMQAGNGVIFASTLTGLVSPDYAVFDPIGDANVEFLGELFRSRKLRAKFRAESKGLGTGTSGFLRLYNDRLGAIHIALPPRVEQRTILSGVAEKLSGVNAAISSLGREIELLREYRTRLVADVVTGKLDVRDAAAHLPEETGPDTAEDRTDLSIDLEAAEEEALV